MSQLMGIITRLQSLQETAEAAGEPTQRYFEVNGEKVCSSHTYPPIAEAVQRFRLKSYRCCQTEMLLAINGYHHETAEPARDCGGSWRTDAALFRSKRGKSMQREIFRKKPNV